MDAKIKTSISISFGKKIRELRKSQNLSQEAFADLSDLDRSYIGGVERGDRNISLNNINKISKALKLNIKELFEDIYD
jgi:transcriptional regulator with XRE-family HTH domain